MTLFETKNVTFALKELFIEKADDRWGGVEPYVVPVFYKIDGQRYRATLRILNSQPPRPGSTEVPAPGALQFSVETLNDAGDTIQEDNPLVYVPPGNLLGRGEFDSHGHVDLSDVSFTTDLIPIPFVIDVLGLPNLTIVDALQGLIVPVEDLQGTLNTFFISLSALIADMFGLDEHFEKCPPGEAVVVNFLNDIEAQFKCLIPGTVGGVFLCMENDEFSEGLARDVRSSLRDEVKTILNNTIDAIQLYNPIPDPDYYIDEGTISDNVGGDLTWPVVAHVGLSLGAIVLGYLTYNPFVAVYGVISSLGWAIGGPDDPIGQATFTVDHTMLEDPAALSFFSRVAGDDNVWYLSGGVTVNS
ncbi:MAG: hypothetical protein WBW88_00975 [Rhodothermales bacterium]